MQSILIHTHTLIRSHAQVFTMPIKNTHTYGQDITKIKSIKLIVTDSHIWTQNVS